jgi:hypothetical protein
VETENGLVTPTTKPLVVLSRVLCGNDREGKLVSAKLRHTGKVEYGVRYDDTSQQWGLDALEVEYVLDFCIDDDDVIEHSRRDLLGKVVYLDELAYAKNREEPFGGDALLGRPAQVTGVRTARKRKKKSTPRHNSDLELTLFFYLDEETPRAGFRISEVSLRPLVLARVPVEQVAF